MVIEDCDRDLIVPQASGFDLMELMTYGWVVWLIHGVADLALARGLM